MSLKSWFQLLQLTQELAQLQESILKQKLVPLSLYIGHAREYFLDLADILFVETDGEKIYGHTKDEAYEVKQNSTELEELLPTVFVGFPNRRLLMLSRFILWRSLFRDQHGEFPYQTHKQVHVSRRYYQVFKRTTKAKWGKIMRKRKLIGIPPGSFWQLW